MNADTLKDQKLIDEAMAKTLSSFEDTMEVTVDEPQLTQLKTIGAFLAIGMSLEEGCVMARMSPVDVKVLMNANPAVRAFILHKETIFKAKLMRTMAEKAFDGSVKEASFLLEQKFPEEFNRKAVAPGDSEKEDDILARGIEHVRKQGDTQPLVPSGV